MQTLTNGTTTDLPTRIARGFVHAYYAFPELASIQVHGEGDDVSVTVVLDGAGDETVELSLHHGSLMVGLHNSEHDMEADFEFPVVYEDLAITAVTRWVDQTTDEFEEAVRADEDADEEDA